MGRLALPVLQHTSTMAEEKAPKVTKAAKPAAHPPYANMIVAAIKALKDKKGSSRQAILKYVVANNKVADADKAAVRVKLALRKLVAAKKVVPAAAAGKKGAGSFKLPAKEPAAKKPKAKKAKKPKAAKKPAAKKAAKPKAKKAAKPKAAKKPAAKKPTAKKAAKKPAAKKAAKK